MSRRSDPSMTDPCALDVERAGARRRACARGRARARLARVAEVAAVWPFVVFAQLLAPPRCAIAHYSRASGDLVSLAATRGGVIRRSLAALAPDQAPFARLWPTHVSDPHMTLVSACARRGPPVAAAAGRRCCRSGRVPPCRVHRGVRRDDDHCGRDLPVARRDPHLRRAPP